MKRLWLSLIIGRACLIACVAALAMLTAAPVIKVAAAGHCHGGQSSAVGGEVFGSLDAHSHGHGHAEVIDQEAAVDRAGRAPAEGQTVVLDCCLPGCCISLAGRPIAPPAPRLGLVESRLTVAADVPQGLSPEGLRRPPRTTDIVGSRA